jgi:hypothetical protein
MNFVFHKNEPARATVRGQVIATAHTGRQFNIKEDIRCSLGTDETAGVVLAFEDRERKNGMAISFPKKIDGIYTVNYPQSFDGMSYWTWGYTDNGNYQGADTGTLELTISESGTKLNGNFVFITNGLTILKGDFDLKLG